MSFGIIANACFGKSSKKKVAPSSKSWERIGCTVLLPDAGNSSRFHIGRAGTIHRDDSQSNYGGQGLTAVLALLLQLSKML